LIDRIIVKSVSRFARNTQELLSTIRFLKDIGVSVYFEEQGMRNTLSQMHMGSQREEKDRMAVHQPP